MPARLICEECSSLATTSPCTNCADSPDLRAEFLRLKTALVTRYAAGSPLQCACCGARHAVDELIVGGPGAPTGPGYADRLDFCRELIADPTLRPALALCCAYCESRFGRETCDHEPVPYDDCELAETHRERQRSPVMREPTPANRYQPIPPPASGMGGPLVPRLARNVLQTLAGAGRSRARGSVIPEPVIGRGVVSGRPYSFGETGPEGVVPSEMLPDFLRRRGGTGSYAYGGEIGYDAEVYPEELTKPLYEPSGGDATVDPGSTSSPMPAFGKGPGGSVRPLQDPYGMTVPPIGETYAPTDPNPAPHDSTNLPWSDPLSGGTPTQTTTGTLPGTSTAPSVIPTAPWQMTPQQQAEINRQLAETTARNQQPAPVQSPTQQPVIAPVAPVQKPLQLPQGPTTAMPVANGPTTAPVAAPVNTFTGQPATNRDVAAAGTFGRSIPNSGPQFLGGEQFGGFDQGGTIASLAQSNMLPPFLSRLLGQANSIQSQSTRTPQAFDLPGNIPVISRLAYEQLLPTERQAFESILSSEGIDPLDYWQYVEQVSPQGGPAPWSPLFGARLNYNRQ